MPYSVTVSRQIRSKEHWPAQTLSSGMNKCAPPHRGWDTRCSVLIYSTWVHRRGPLSLWPCGEEKIRRANIWGNRREWREQVAVRMKGGRGHACTRPYFSDPIGNLFTLIPRWLISELGEAWMDCSSLALEFRISLLGGHWWIQGKKRVAVLNTQLDSPSLKERMTQDLHSINAAIMAEDRWPFALSLPQSLSDLFAALTVSLVRAKELVGPVETVWEEAHSAFVLAERWERRGAMFPHTTSTVPNLFLIYGEFGFSFLLNLTLGFWQKKKKSICTHI
jgi:hypothetical protein